MTTGLDKKLKAALPLLRRQYFLQTVHGVYIGRPGTFGYELDNDV